jgi:protein-disulfide isomerase
MVIRRFVTENRLVVTLLIATVVLQIGILQRESAVQVQPAPEQIRKAPEGATIDISGMPVLGSGHARVVVIEFSDYECPFCRRHATSVFQEIQDEFVATDQIQYAFANNPLAIHPNALYLASAALCAGDQGGYWTMHDRLFHEQPRSAPDVLALVQDANLDAGVFEECVNDDGVAGRVRGDAEVARGLGLSGTPAFAIGRVDTSGRVAVDTLISGAQPLDVFKGVLERML